jgi:lysophospholipase L1-like esterase
MTRLRDPWPTVFLTVFGTLFALGVLETGARVVAVREERRQGRLERDLGQVKDPSSGSVVTLGQIIRMSRNPRIVYELRPRLDVLFSGAHLTTSDSGYRGRDVRTPKPAGTYRILGLGDSYLFGQGVADDETYLARLPGLLRVAWPDRSIEAVNLAVPGFNTVMEVEMLRERAAVLEPDLILIEIVGNDLDLPNFLWNPVDFWTPRRSFLLDFIRGRLVAGASSAQGLVESPREAGPTGRFSRDPERVPAEYASMVGFVPFDRALRDLRDLGRARHVPVLALTHGVWFEDAMLKSLADAGIPVLVLRSALRQRARSLGAPDYARSPLALSPNDLHPSALGHEVIAGELAAWLKSQVAH